VSERAAGDVGEDLLHDGVAAVLVLGLDEPDRGVGEDGVVAPDGEQLALAAGGLLVLVADPADDEAGGDGLAFLRRERRVLGLGDLGVGDPAAQLVIEDRLRVLDAVQAPSGIAAMAVRMLEFIGAVTENRAPCARIALIMAAL